MTALDDNHLNWCAISSSPILECIKFRILLDYLILKSFVRVEDSQWKTSNCIFTEFSLEPDESSIWVSELQKRQESVTLNLNFYYELNTPNFRFDSLCCYHNIFRANVLLLEIISFEWIWSLFYKSVRKTYFWLDISSIFLSKFIYSNELPWSYYILFGKILMIALNDFV